MRMSRATRLRLRGESVLFVVLLLAVVGMLAWLSEHYKHQWDWTSAGRNSLSQASRELLATLDGPVEIVAYAREQPLLRQSVQQLVERYQRAKPDIALSFVDPDRVPDQVRELGISVDGELLVEYRGRREHAKALTEQAVSSALERVARGDSRWVAYLVGHGEREMLGQANHDAGRLGAELERRGFELRELILAEAGEVPSNIALLVVTQPRAALLPGEAEALLRYLARGGNLLWLHDPGPLNGLEPVARALGIEFEPGVVVTPTTQALGIEHPAFVPVSSYPSHVLTRDFDLITVFPQAAAIAWEQPQGWDTRGILGTGLRAWSETGPLEGEIGYDDGADVAGPLDIGVAMTRPLPENDERGVGGAEQRVVVIGDGDFVSNVYLGNGGNLDLALKIFNWLADDDTLVAVPAKRAPDLDFDLTRNAALAIAAAALFVLPLAFFGTGTYIWHRRRRR